MQRVKERARKLKPLKRTKNKKVVPKKRKAKKEKLNCLRKNLIS